MGMVDIIQRVVLGPPPRAIKSVALSKPYLFKPCLYDASLGAKVFAINLIRGIFHQEGNRHV